MNVYIFASYHERCKISHIIMQVVNHQEDRIFFLYVDFKWYNFFIIIWGRTIHSKFEIFLPTFDNSVYNIYQGFELVDILK
ncbi:hypothetical protein Lal_00037954 [Lupinus albus]|nr:hypothetical protein Lal_00037954 [Lupinus albus]